jgi:hypothetical protein
MFCPKCGAQGVGTDKFCRACGASLPLIPVQQQPKRKRSWLVRAMLWAGGILLGLSLVHAIYSTQRQGTGQGAADTQQVEPQQAEPRQSEPQTYQIGQEFSVGYWTYRVNGAYWTPLLGVDPYSMERANGEFVVVDVTARNDDTSSSMLPPFQLADAKGRTYDESSGATFEQGFFSGLKSLNPDVSDRGDVAFDVPPGRQYVLVLSGGIESGKQVYVPLPSSAPTAQQPGSGGPSQGAAQPPPGEDANPGGPTSPSESTDQTTPGPVPGVTSENQTAQPQATFPEPPSSQPGAASSGGLNSPTPFTVPQSPPRVNSPVIAASTVPQPPRAVMKEVPPGTTVEVLIADPVVSDINRTGDIFRGSLEAPIVVAGQVVVPSGASIFLRALQILSPHRRGELTEIRLVLDHLDYRGRSYLLDSSSFDLANPSGKRIRVSPGTTIQFNLLGAVAIRGKAGVGIQ